jgi:hypothetical protein
VSYLIYTKSPVRACGCCQASSRNSLLYGTRIFTRLHYLTLPRTRSLCKFCDDSVLASSMRLLMFHNQWPEYIPCLRNSCCVYLSSRAEQQPWIALYEPVLFHHYDRIIFTILSRCLFLLSIDMAVIGIVKRVNPLTPELNPSEQRCMTRFFTGDFASWTVHFFNICVKNQQM